jgi:hypothetical protein
LCDRAVFTHPERERQLPLMSGGPYGIDASAHLLLERALSAPQIDLICDRCARLCGAQASAPIGGSRVSRAAGAVAARDGDGGGACYRMTVKGPSAAEGTSK